MYLVTILSSFANKAIDIYVYHIFNKIIINSGSGIVCK